MEFWSVLVPLLTAHILTDFFLQTREMVTAKEKNNLMTFWSYLHAGIAGVTAYLLVASWTYHYIFWVTAISHLFIDAWKNSRKNTHSLPLFFIDQFMHLLIIVGLYFWITGWGANREFITGLPMREVSIIGLGLLFVTRPSSVIIQKLMKQWNYNSMTMELPGAGHYIGILERILLYVFVLFNQFSAIGLLIAAKSILRYGSKVQAREETEYILVGTLLSFTIAVLSGLIIKSLL